MHCPRRLHLDSMFHFFLVCRHRWIRLLPLRRRRRLPRPHGLPHHVRHDRRAHGGGASGQGAVLKTWHRVQHQKTPLRLY